MSAKSDGDETYPTVTFSLNSFDQKLPESWKFVPGTQI
jgi:hypothetical protein